jgi:putative PIN family toxin of toxin-antitoxin system
MIKVVIDTNVLVSAFIQRSYPYFIVDHISANKEFVWCISEEILDEYAEVLKTTVPEQVPPPLPVMSNWMGCLALLV